MLKKQTPSEIYRHEIKYFISKQDAFLLGHTLSRCMRSDIHMKGSGGYWIRSLYFDSQDNRDYWGKVNGYPDRRKIRIRIYQTDTESVKLEIKNKSNCYILKETVEISRDDSERLIRGESFPLLSYQNQIANKVYNYFYMERMKPILLIDYEREAFLYPFENIRITIDKDVRASISPLSLYDKYAIMLPVFNDERYILEVKYHTCLPFFIKKILSGLNLELTSASKYCLARQAVCI
jgi:hypothetical protein